MRLLVLGCSGTYPRPGGACNGFLLQDDGVNLVLDFGNGCMSNLLREIPFTGIDALVITHMHVDHFGDLYPLYYALRFHPEKPWGMRLLLPTGGLEVVGRIMGGESRELLGEVFREESINEKKECRVGRMTLSFHPTFHPVEGYSVRVEGEGWTFAYSSDTSPCPGLQAAAEGVDLFICEATLPRAYHREASHGHLTSTQAGEAARRAGAARLVLTHIWPTFDVEEVRREAEEAFGGEVIAAKEGMWIEVEGR
jgi:ribonuclease BN (tRNA processing enzyme)